MKTERLWHFQMCHEQFPGLTVDEMLERLSSVEVLDWITYLSMKREAEKKARDEASRR